MKSATLSLISILSLPEHCRRAQPRTIKINSKQRGLWYGFGQVVGVGRRRWCWRQSARRRRWPNIWATIDEQKQSGTHLRSTAILEYTGDLKDMKQSRLVPIAIWDGAQYQPGGLYLAQPAPLAVLSGTQYELQDSGKPEGFFNIRDAEDLAGLWIGVGSYEAPPPPKAKAPASRSNHTYVVKDVDPDKPHFAHRPAEEQETIEGFRQCPGTSIAEGAPCRS